MKRSRVELISFPLDNLLYLVMLTQKYLIDTLTGDHQF